MLNDNSCNPTLVLQNNMLINKKHQYQQLVSTLCTLPQNYNLIKINYYMNKNKHFNFPELYTFMKTHNIR